jgi:hypothetical protein
MEMRQAFNYMNRHSPLAPQIQEPELDNNQKRVSFLTVRAHIEVQRQRSGRQKQRAARKEEWCVPARPVSIR